MERSLDYKGRWRNHTVAFRVSDEEAKLLNDLVALSGLTKQEYIIRRLTCRDVVVQGNPRVYKALKNQMAAIHEELKRLETVSPDNDELIYRLLLFEFSFVFFNVYYEVCKNLKRLLPYHLLAQMGGSRM